MLAYLEQRDLSQLDRWSRERWSLSSVSSCWNKLIHRWSNDDFRRVLRAAERDVHTAEVFVNVETMEQRASAYRTAAVLCRWQKLQVLEIDGQNWSLDPEMLANSDLLLERCELG